jgi:hypothetical protein
LKHKNWGVEMLKTIYLAILVSFVASSISGIEVDLECEKKAVDDYDYQFHSSSEFDRTGGDEFEILDSKCAGRSEISSLDSNGNKKILKENEKFPRINPDKMNQTNAQSLARKKDLLAYLVGVQQTFSVGKGSNENETKILRYRYRFENSGNNHYLDWSPFYSCDDYNFYNSNYISFQIKHSGIDGTVRGFESYRQARTLLEK